MATPTLAASRPVRHTARRIVLAVVVVVLVALGGVGTWFYSAARAALPQIDGTISLAGLSAPVTVIRDAHGVPHITAATMHDLLFAQGYVTAQDRLWQMDMTRRYAAGELAEILGADYVKSDRLQRTLGMRQVAERALAAMSAEDRAGLEAYARGVNAYISSRGKALPLEFRVLGYTPRPWQPEDSLLVGTSFWEALNLSYMRALLSREKVLAKVPPELGADLYPMTSWRDHPPMQVEPEIKPGEESDEPEEPAPPHRLNRRNHQAALPEYAPALAPTELFPGSNNWVVSGAHTASGKPLLANDMHLPHNIPNVWYEAHLTLAPSSGADFDVAGVNAPGLPGILVGHNRRIAWGFTNLNPACMDLYVETFNAAGEYQTPTGWQKPERRREVIHVRGKADMEIDVIATRHGPIVTDLLPGETRKLALKWVLWDRAALSMDFITEADTARNWDEFRRAFSHFAGPGQNVVYADVDGHIGYQATGFAALRKNGDATKPVPGNTDDYAWTGYLPFDQMPRVFDPASGIIATANNRITPDGYPHLLSAEWGSPERAERIYRVLRSDKKFSAADMLALQTDIYSDFDRFCAERFTYAVDHTAGASARARQAADLMRKWDARVAADAAAPTVVARAETQLRRLLLEPLLGPAPDGSDTGWRMYNWWMSTVWLENMLLRQPARWLPKNYKSWDELMTAAVEQAVDRSHGAPRDLSQWRWGEASPLYLQHPLFGRVPLLRRWTGPGLLPQSGSGHTVKQVGRGFGPSERMTTDFADLDASTLNIVTGQSGNLFSPYYMDQWTAWYGGSTFALPFSPEAVGKVRAHELRLEPLK